MKLFIWKVNNNGLLVNFERRRRGLTDHGGCPICDEGEETLDHLFRRCSRAIECWRISNAPRDFTAYSHAPLEKWIENSCADNKKKQEEKSWQTSFPYILWNLWKARNKSVFDGIHMTAREIIMRARYEAIEARTILLKHNGPVMAKQVWVSWNPPPQGVLKLNTDGSMVSSTGMASAGGVFRDHQGAWVFGYVTKIGTTNSSQQSFGVFGRG